MLHQIVAGALFDFLGHLTTRDGCLEIGGSSDCSVFPLLLTEWAATRGLDLKDANVERWGELLAEQILPMTLDSGASLSIQSIGGHVTRDGQDPKWGRDAQDVWPRELTMARLTPGQTPVVVDYVHAESAARAMVVLMAKLGETLKVVGPKGAPADGSAAPPEV